MFHCVLGGLRKGRSSKKKIKGEGDSAIEEKKIHNPWRGPPETATE